ncbi:sodium/potassium/calcium exchanger 1-like isoform X1 [Engraulis encrasicolus]|uniref:sodium/potassium/calcium exchanger 1-like isoform X1 n=2 Tax=Engraulis encrasicolus TaxID=184585 RepID=UPI002FD0D2A2
MSLQLEKLYAVGFKVCLLVQRGQKPATIMTPRSVIGAAGRKGMDLITSMFSSVCQDWQKDDVVTLNLEEVPQQAPEQVLGEEVMAEEEQVAEGEEVMAEEEQVAEGEEVMAEEEQVAEGEEVMAEEEQVAEGEEVVTEEEQVAEGEEVVTEEEQVAEEVEEAVVEVEEGEQEKEVVQMQEKAEERQGKRRVAGLVRKQRACQYHQAETYPIAGVLKERTRRVRHAYCI